MMLRIESCFHNAKHRSRKNWDMLYGWGTKFRIRIRTVTYWKTFGVGFTLKQSLKHC